METAGGLYVDGSEAEGPCVFLASFSGAIYGDYLRDSCNIIALCNHMWLKASVPPTMTPAFPSGGLQYLLSSHQALQLLLVLVGGLPTTNQLVNSPSTQLRQL
jgi:hypothetical protein